MGCYCRIRKLSSIVFAVNCPTRYCGATLTLPSSAPTTVPPFNLIAASSGEPPVQYRAATSPAQVVPRRDHANLHTSDWRHQGSTYYTHEDGIDIQRPSSPVVVKPAGDKSVCPKTPQERRPFVITRAPAAPARDEVSRSVSVSASRSASASQSASASATEALSGVHPRSMFESASGSRSELGFLS